MRTKWLGVLAVLLTVYSAQAALITTTTFDGAGALNAAGEWSNGLPSNANPGLVSSTGNAWTGGVWTDFAVRQTGGYVYASPDGSGNFAMRGGASGSGNATILEIEDARTSYGTYTNFNVGGILTMWAQNGERQELNILSGVVEIGTLNASTDFSKSSISMKNGVLHIAGIQTLKATFNFLSGGSGAVTIDDTLGVSMANTRLDFETGSEASFTLGSVNGGAGTLGILNFLVGNGNVRIDGLTVTDSSKYEITTNGIAATLSVVPEPATLGLFIVAGASCMLIRRIAR